MKKLRRKLLVDRPVQLGLTGRVLLHWAMFILLVAIVLPLYQAIFLGDIERSLAERTSQAVGNGIILFSLFGLLFPYFVYDILRISNRFAGPMFRLHRNMNAVAEGKQVAQIKFRDGDYWQGVAEDFNRIVARLNALEARVKVQEEASGVEETEEDREPALVD